MLNFNYAPHHNQDILNTKLGFKENNPNFALFGEFADETWIANSNWVEFQQTPGDIKETAEKASEELTES